MGQLQYLCETWQGLIQQAVSNLGKGYYEYQKIEPKFKAIADDKWLHIDYRLLSKFNIVESNKNKRAYNKRLGNANYSYLRFNNFALLLKTIGEVYENTESENWKLIHDVPLIIPISELITLKIGRGRTNKGITVYFTNEAYKTIKEDIFENIRHRQLRNIYYKFGALNNIPSYAGIIEQKRMLKKEIIIEATKHNLTLDKRILWIGCRRKMYKVYSDE